MFFFSLISMLIQILMLIQRICIKIYQLCKDMSSLTYNNYVLKNIISEHQPLEILETTHWRQINLSMLTLP